MTILAPTSLFPLLLNHCCQNITLRRHLADGKEYPLGFPIKYDNNVSCYPYIQVQQVYKEVL